MAYIARAMSTRSCRYIIPLLLALLLLPGILRAQGRLVIASIDTSRFPVMRASFFPLDTAGNRHNRLADYDIRLEENGLLRNVRLVDCPPESPPRPVSSVLAIDVSGSMGGERIAIAREAARLWINELPLGLSECALTSFDDRGYLNSDFTTDRARLLARLNGLIPRGGTNYDAGLIDPPAGALLVAANGRARRVVVFLTDGQGRGDQAAIITAARDANTSVYCVTLGMSMPPILRAVATASGGAWFENITTVEEARAVYRAILLDAQGILPCSVEWETSVDCDSTHRLVLFDNLHAVADTAAYLVPQRFRPTFLASQTGLSFGGVGVGLYSDLSVDLAATNAPVTLQGLSVDDPRFTIITGAVPPRVTVLAGGSHHIVVRYTSTDSSFVFARLNVTSDGCTSPVVFIGAGFPGVPPQVASLRLVAPNGAERFAVGEETELVWIGVLPSDPVRLEYSTDDGLSWRLVADNATGLRYRWRVPNRPSNRCLARVVQPNPGGLDSVMVLSRHISGVEAVAFSRDGGLVATGGIDDTVWIWNAYTGALVRGLVGVSRGVVSIEFNPDGTHLLVGSGLGYILVFDLVSGNIVQVLSGPPTTSVARYSPDGRYVAAHTYRGEVTLWDTTTGGLVRQFLGHNARGFTLRFSPDGGRIVSGSFDSTARVWDVATGNQLALLAGHKGSVNGVTFSPDGVWAVTASSDHTIRFWNAATGAEKSVIDEGDEVNEVRFTSDGKWLVSGGADHLVKLRSPTSGAIGRLLVGHTERVTALASSPDGRRLVSGSFDNSARIWNLEAGALQSDSSDRVWSIVAPLIDAITDLDMGNVAVGSYRDSVVQIYLCNKGEVAARIDTMLFGGPDSSDFSLVVTDAPFTLLPGECRAVEFRFTPSLSGIRNADVLIVLGGDTLRRAITGWGYRHRLEVEIPLVDFGGVIVGRQRDTTVTAILRNIGPSPIDVVESSITGPDQASFVVVSGSAPFSLAPGDAHAMMLRFVPGRVGGANSTLSFATSTGDSGLVATLAGRGVCDTAVRAGTLQPESMRGSPGERIAIPIAITSLTTSPTPEQKQFVLRVRFNPRVLVLQGDSIVAANVAVGIIVSNTIAIYDDDSTQTIEVSGVWDGRSNTLIRLPFLVALGDSDRTDLRVTAFAWLDDCAPALQRGGSLFLVDGICRDGSGARLVRTEGNALLKSIRPNPTDRGGAVVDYELLEHGRTRIRLFDIRGNEVLRILDADASPGNYSISINTELLPAGRYVMRLETPTQQRTMEMEISNR